MKAREAVESEHQRGATLNTSGTGFGELCEENYIPTVSAILNTSETRMILLNVPFYCIVLSSQQC